MRVFNWCFIGAGAIANKVAKEITKSKKHCVVSVYSRTKSKADTFADLYNAKSYNTLEEAILDSNVNAVYIATPHSAHYQNILSAIECKKPILCEKSFTVNTKQAKQVFELAKANKVYLAEAMWTRFNPIIRKVIEIVSENKIGKIKSIEANFCVPLQISKPITPKRAYLPEYAGGALLDLGVYPISFAHALLGIPDSISCNMRLLNGIDMRDEIVLGYGDTKAYLCSSFDELKTFTAKIIGEKGEIKIPMFYRPKKAVIKIGNKKTKLKAKAGYTHQFDKVAQDILENKLSNQYISPQDTLSVMAIMDECRNLNHFKYPLSIEKLT